MVEADESYLLTESHPSLHDVLVTYHTKSAYINVRRQPALGRRHSDKIDHLLVESNLSVVIAYKTSRPNEPLLDIPCALAEARAMQIRL